MTPAQITTLRQAIAAEKDATFVAHRAARDTTQMADWLNGPSAFIVWRTLITEHEITRNTSDENTTWSWTAFIARSEAERSAWARMFNGTYSTNPSLQNVRAAFADIFSGGTGAAQRAHLLAVGKRAATRFERIFATGTGTRADPGLMVIEGLIDEFRLRGIVWADNGDWLGG